MPKTFQNRGSSLVETVIAMGVLAVAVPLVFASLAESGKSSMSAEAETRSAWIVPNCVAEILASREGRPQFFSATAANEIFPPMGDVWALGFSQDGKLVGKVSKAAYDKGAKDLDGKPIRYIASISSATAATVAGTAPMLRARIFLEYPSGIPLEKRQKLEFHSRIP